MAVLYEEVASGYCTDAFTQNILLGRLAHVPWIETILYWIIIAVILLGVVSYLSNIVYISTVCSQRLHYICKIVSQESAIQANLTLRHSRLVLRSFIDRMGELRWRYELEPISGGALVTIQSEQSVFTIAGSQNVRRSWKLGH